MQKTGQFFYEQLKSSTKECKFSDAENMARLRKALKGKARETVSAMLTLPGNLNRVIETLERRFGRPDTIIECMVEKTKALSAPSEGDMVGLIDLSNAVTNLVTTMELLNSDGHLKNPELRRQLAGKVPSALRLQWGERAHGCAELNLRDFATWLAGRADAASFVTMQARSSDETAQQRGTARPRREGRALNASTTQCFSISCTEAEKQLKILAVAERKAFACKNRICWNCLKQHHRAAKCRSGARCPKCQQKHHPAMHDALVDVSEQANTNGQA